MKCHILFYRKILVSRKNKKNISLSSAEFANSMISSYSSMLFQD